MNLYPWRSRRGKWDEVCVCVCVCVYTYSLLLLVAVADYHVEQSKFDKLEALGLRFGPISYPNGWKILFLSILYLSIICPI